MPRKTSRAKKSTVATDAKGEEAAPRRSGRAVTKPETVAAGRDPTRSRRSSTAAQTAASVADSNTPKGRTSVSSRGESPSPSDSRTRGGKVGGDAPTSRAKPSRRSTSRINYKESDGEEEVAPSKYEDNFESGEEFEDSDSDEKSKPQGKGRAAKVPTRGRVSKGKSKRAPQGRRGRPSRKKVEEEEEEDDENETVDVSDDSAEPDGASPKKETVDKGSAKPTRSRRPRSEVTEVKSVEPKPSRRSGRSTLSKEESPKKRPSRGQQAKRYAEEDEEDVEEVSDSKPEEEGNEGSRKRKRDASPEDASKRLKEDDDSRAETVEDIKAALEEDKPVEEVKDKEKSVEEPMEVDETAASPVPSPKRKPEEETEDKPLDPKVDVESGKMIVEEKEEKEKEKPATEKSSPTKKQEVVDSAEKPKTGATCPKPEGPASVELDKAPNAKKVGNDAPAEASTDQLKKKVAKTPEISEAAKDASPVSKSVAPSVIAEAKSEKIPDKIESKLDPATKLNEEVKKIDSSKPVEEKPSPPMDTTPAPTPAPVMISPPKETKSDASLKNGSDCIKDALIPVHDTKSTTNAHTEPAEKVNPKPNGAHNDVQHTNSTASADQHYSNTGRKYVINSKLNENLRQSLKTQTFGFVSYNLGTPSSEAYLQKDKLLRELNVLDAHIICLQQVAKHFYTAVLEPSLDALGFKSVFSQPEESLKGMATFYKSSLFRLSSKSDISLKQLIEREVEVSSLDGRDRTAVKAHIKKCGNVLFTHFSTVIGTQTVTVANVQIPPTDLSVHALQVSCLAQEVVRINGGTNKPLLLGGEFNIAENDASYQLLRDGYLSNDMIEELQRRKDVVLPEKENASLVNLLWKAFQHPSSNLCSCYTSVLDHEFVIPELKKTSTDLLWYGSGSLHTFGVLDVSPDRTGDHHFSLKADVAFSV